MYSGGIKINKSEKPDNQPFTEYYVHDTPKELRDWSNEDYIQVISIDPALVHFAIRVERWYPHTKQVLPILYEKISLVDPITNPDKHIGPILVNLQHYLDSKYETFQHSHFVHCEKQMPQNYKTLRVSQHVISYFMTKLKNNDLLSSVVEIDPKLKGKTLSAPSKLDYHGLKKWSVVEAERILTERKDEISLNILKQTKKKDDLADIICQTLAYFKSEGLDFQVIPDDLIIESAKIDFVSPIPIPKTRKKPAPRKKKIAIETVIDLTD